MKKFRFSLETVLDYKQQVLDALRIEHAAAQAKARGNGSMRSWTRSFPSGSWRASQFWMP